MELFTTTGFTKGDYGKWLNVCMEAAPCEWVLIHDHDIFFVHPKWFDMVCGNIKKADNPGLLSCVTNRIGNPHQKVMGIKDSDDLFYHYEIALDLENKESPIEATRPISGLMMVTSKTAWKAAGGFRSQKTIIGLDNDYHKRVEAAGFKAYLMPNVYVYHKYRKWGSVLSKPERGEEKMGDAQTRQIKKNVEKTTRKGELVEALNKALASGKFLITISHKEGKPPDDLKHWHLMVNYPTDDIISTMEHHIGRLKKEVPALSPTPIGVDEIGKEWV